LDQEEAGGGQGGREGGRGDKERRGGGRGAHFLGALRRQERVIGHNFAVTYPIWVILGWIPTIWTRRRPGGPRGAGGGKGGQGKAGRGEGGPFPWRLKAGKNVLLAITLPSPTRIGSF
jgi:hypothetical protein